MFLGLPNIQNVSSCKNSGLQIPIDHPFISSHLDITDCNVNSVSGETFANVSALELVDVSFSNLRSVDLNILRALPKLTTLYLYGKWLQCDCQQQEVWRCCQDRSTETAYVECDTPSEVKGRGWGVLQKGQCLQDNIQYYTDYKNTSYNYTNIEDSHWYEYRVEFLKQ